MKKFLFFLTAICVSAVFYSCNSENWQEGGISGTVSPELEMVEVENPFAMEEAAAVDKAMDFFTETVSEPDQASLRSFGLEGVKTEVKACNYKVSLMKKSGEKKRNIAQIIPIYRKNLHNSGSTDPEWKIRYNNPY